MKVGSDKVSSLSFQKKFIIKTTINCYVLGENSGTLFFWWGGRVWEMVGEGSSGGHYKRPLYLQGRGCGPKLDGVDGEAGQGVRTF